MLLKALPKLVGPCPPPPPVPPPPRPNNADRRRWKLRSTSSKSFCDCCGRFQGLRFSPPGSFQAMPRSLCVPLFEQRRILTADPPPTRELKPRAVRGFFSRCPPDRRPCCPI